MDMDQGPTVDEWPEFSSRLIPDFLKLGNQGPADGTDFWILGCGNLSDRDLYGEVRDISIQKRYVSILLFSASLKSAMIESAEVIVQDFPRWAIWIVDKADHDELEIVQGSSWDDSFIWDNYEDGTP